MRDPGQVPKPCLLKLNCLMGMGIVPPDVTPALMGTASWHPSDFLSTHWPPSKLLSLIFKVPPARLSKCSSTINLSSSPTMPQPCCLSGLGTYSALAHGRAFVTAPSAEMLFSQEQDSFIPTGVFPRERLYWSNTPHFSPADLNSGLQTSLSVIVALTRSPVPHVLFTM